MDGPIVQLVIALILYSLFVSSSFRFLPHAGENCHNRIVKHLDSTSLQVVINMCFIVPSAFFLLFVFVCLCFSCFYYICLSVRQWK